LQSAAMKDPLQLLDLLFPTEFHFSPVNLKSTLENLTLKRSFN